MSFWSRRRRRLLLGGGRYELCWLLGRGGMADVWRDVDQQLDRPVAVKVLRPNLARNSDILSRFHREARSVAAFNHSSIVAFHDMGVDRRGDVETPFIVMEHVDGCTLREVLTRIGRVRPTEAQWVICQLLGALGYSHHHGVVHCDVKPDNVMVSTAGDVKLIDFGISRDITDPATSTKTVVGTARYLSPEQADGSPVDARSDIYATGCLLYELLTGTPPFPDTDARAVAHRHLCDVPPSPSALEPAIPPAHAAIAMRALAKTPACRYQNAAEMEDAIKTVLAAPARDRGPAAGPSSSRRRQHRHCHRRGPACTLVATVGLTLTP